jgi:hypothetical protein
MTKINIDELNQYAHLDAPEFLREFVERYGDYFVSLQIAEQIAQVVWHYGQQLWRNGYNRGKEKSQ